MPNARNAAQGKKPNELKFGKKYALAREGMPTGSIMLITGARKQITKPIIVHSRMRSRVVNTAMGANSNMARPMQFKISTRSSSLAGLVGKPVTYNCNRNKNASMNK